MNALPKSSFRAPAKTQRLRSFTALRLAAIVCICDVAGGAYAQHADPNRTRGRLPPLPEGRPAPIPLAAPIAPVAPVAPIPPTPPDPPAPLPELPVASPPDEGDDENAEDSADESDDDIRFIDDHERHHRAPRAPKAPKPPKPPKPPRRPHVHVPAPHVHVHPIVRPRVEVEQWGRARVLILREGEGAKPTSFHRHGRRKEEPEADQPATSPPPASRDGRAHGGLALAAGGARYFGLVPADDVMVGARLQLAAAFPTLPIESSRWLSSGTFGLSGGYAVGRDRGIDAQVWHVGVVFAMGAPWTRDFIGVAAEGGVLGASYYDNNPQAFAQSSNQMVVGPHGESSGPKPYGVGRLTLQVPLEGDVRPYVAGDFGAAGRDDGRLAGIVTVTGGLVWNAW